MKPFRAYLPLNQQTLLAGQPAVTPARFTTGLKKEQLAGPVAGHQAASRRSRPAGSAPAEARHLVQPRQLAWQQWGAAFLDVLAAEFWLAADWGDLLLHPWATLGEFLEPPCVAVPPQQRLPTLVAALPDDHA